MPKSAIDATRFTPTTPHASAKHPPLSNSTSSSTASKTAPPLPNRTMTGQPGETPQQKVRRLREAAARTRDAKISGFDKVVLRGRVWADRAHRFTALSLIGITAVAGVITVYALGDMMIHNRRKRREYFAEQKALHDAAIYEAQTAVRNGLASDEQMALVENEERGRLAVKAREMEKTVKKGDGVFARGRKWLFNGLKKEEGVGEAEVEMVGSELRDGEGDAGEDGMARRTELEERMRMRAAGIGTAPGEESDGMSGMGRESAILRAVEEQNAEIREKMEDAIQRERKREVAGGMLDRLGTSGESGEKTPKQEGGGGWTSFLSRR